VTALDLSGQNLAAPQDAPPNGLLFCQCDVTDDTEIRAAVDAVLQKWNRMDVQINNACPAIFSPFEGISLEQTRREFEVNYSGYVRDLFLARLCPNASGKMFSNMTERGRG
jgi:NAD(P)-dependent dehydrogenase (short-subunit alcohol dehydrogenase family)